MSSESMAQLRTALKAFGAAPVTVPQLAGIFGLTNESQKQVLRGRLDQLIKQTEVEKTGRGEFRWIGAAPRRQGETYRRLWRIIRTQPPSWSRADVARLARTDRSMADRYVPWLEDEGFVVRCGRKGNTLLYRTTSQAREQRETPWPPRDLPDPYEQEKAAAAGLITCMLTQNPDQPAVRERIRAHLGVLRTRFEDEDSTANTKTEE